LVNNVAREIDDPETKLSVWKRAQRGRIANTPPDHRAELRSRPDLHIGVLGSGSDFSVFLDHLGVASVDAGFGGEDFGGLQYHSIYDDFYWFTHYSDTDFAYGRALAKTMGTMVMRLGDAEVLPFEFGNFSETIRTYLTELKKLAADQRAEIEERNREIEEGVYQAAADPHKKFVAPVKEALPPYLNFAPLENAVDGLSRSAERYEKALAAAGGRAPVAVNARLISPAAGANLWVNCSTVR
jgi:N-acetylated-alpha-linked acidic dipeptidase